MPPRTGRQPVSKLLLLIALGVLAAALFVIPRFNWKLPALRSSLRTSTSTPSPPQLSTIQRTMATNGAAQKGEVYFLSHGVSPAALSSGLS